ncbi:MAG: LLM class flavin-dependent oxidoreductase [Alphaproteobacteria bacterium]|nr:LLM class flavin-dependent oxidoreductase [Alphaproteobacteria bacterium]
MKFGLFGGANSKRGGANADTTDYRRVIDMIREADDLGFHSIFMVEHHFTGIGQVSATLSMLAYLAAVTKRIRLGTGVTVLPWHNPVLVAEQAATVDLLSNGRLDFGVGRGYRDLEFHGFAMDKSEAEGRYRESIDLILRAFTSDERFSHAGKYWKFDDIIVEPPTIQKPHPPVWTAAGSDDSIRRVARDGWNVMFDQFANIARTQERLAIWRDECKALGRTYDPMQVCVARGLTIVKSDEEYRKALEARHLRTVNFIKEFGNLPGQTGAKPAGVQLQPQSYSDNLFEDETGALIGKPGQVIRQIEVLRDMGFEYILLLMPNDPEILRIFAREIMPHFARESVAAK